MNQKKTKALKPQQKHHRPSPTEPRPGHRRQPAAEWDKAYLPEFLAQRNKNQYLQKDVSWLVLST